MGRIKQIVYTTILTFFLLVWLLPSLFPGVITVNLAPTSIFMLLLASLLLVVVIVYAAGVGKDEKKAEGS